MDNAGGIISVLETFQKVSVAFFILFIIISVILFFAFDIKTIFNIRTGRAKKRTITEMQEANSTTGRLRVGGKTLTSQLDKKSKRKNKNASSYTLTGNASTIATASVTDDISASNCTPVTQNSVINNIKYEPLCQPTEQLSDNYGNSETTVLNNVNSCKFVDIHFKVTKKIVIVHTDEIIS